MKISKFENVEQMLESTIFEKATKVLKFDISYDEYDVIMEYYNNLQPTKAHVKAMQLAIKEVMTQWD